MPRITIEHEIKQQAGRLIYIWFACEWSDGSATCLLRCPPEYAKTFHQTVFFHSTFMMI